VALVVLAPLGALLVQVGALRLRPQVAVVGGLASVVVFAAVALLFVPGHGAVGATAAALAGVATGTLASALLLPGAAGRRLVAVSVLGALAVVGAAAVA
jgi:hypothetical protein